MAKIELVMPKMGESIMEATILKWVKQVGDTVEEDDTILEIATDKVDSEVPSPTNGVITEILFSEDDVVAVGEVIAIISTEGEEPAVAATPSVATPTPAPQPTSNGQVTSAPAAAPQPAAVAAVQSSSDRFYSPLVKNIAKEESISQGELDTIAGTGKDGRVTKNDILAYVANRGTAPAPAAAPQPAAAPKKLDVPPSMANAPQGGAISDDVEIIEMDRMRKLIADHMVRSKHTSPHVTSFVEADVTDIVNWRNSVKKDFQKKYGEKITFTPIIMEAVAKAILDFPLINVSVEGNQIHRKKSINLGMAAALPSGNLIVPVIKNAENLSLLGMTRAVNDLANRARANKLTPDEIQGGTFTVTNVGTFGNVMGTPIINQPQVAIMAAGAIRKMPSVVETEYGDLIAVRHKMFISLSYDHRVVDGMLGGSFLRRIADYLEDFDKNRTI